MSRSRSMLVAVVLVCAACGGSDDGDAAGATTPPTTAAPETTVETSPSTSVAATTVAPTTPTSAPEEPATSDSSSSESSPQFSGDPDSQWCVLNRERDAAADALDESTMFDPELLEAFVTSSMADLAEAAAVAPPEIAADVALALEYSALYRESLEASGYDVLSAELSMMSDPEYVAASERLDAYAEQVCGIIPDPTDSAVPDGTFGEQFVAQLIGQGFSPAEADCILSEIDFAALLSAASDAEQQAITVAAFDACEISEERLNEIGAA